MDILLERYDQRHLDQALAIWNQVVEQGDSFPGDTPLTAPQAHEMFLAQTETVCALAEGQVVGVYILHPNGIGRLSHIANASYAVFRECRGRGLGRRLVEDSLKRAEAHGFSGLQFNAVVSRNIGAIALYLKLGFSVVGTVKNGYRLKDGSFSDMLIMLKTW